jgi:3,4-dihydroxy 2-butanone 4-phosphate synthase/GTP cyclohydrolase II
VRVQTANILDILLAKPTGDRWYLAKALEFIAKHDGVLVFLQEQYPALDLLQQIKLSQMEASAPTSLRHIGLGSQILLDLGVTKMRLLSSPIKMSALSGFGLEVVEYVKLEKETI